MVHIPSNYHIFTLRKGMIFPLNIRQCLFLVLLGSANGLKSFVGKIIMSSIQGWPELKSGILRNDFGTKLDQEFALRRQGKGSANTDNEIRLFDITSEPRVTFFKDRASWCPYCQKVWILLEEKRIPYRIEKINMRSYGDKPAEFLRMCPNGLLPAIKIDSGPVQTESLDIMLTLDQMFQGSQHRPMWPNNAAESQRGEKLMRLERGLFSDWCQLVFRPSPGNSAMKRFEQTMDEVNRELEVTSSPWFLSELSIVDLTYVTHIERMCASVAFWSGRQIRGSRWPAIERWLQAFEAMPSYQATKSDYYTHAMDIPPQYGPGYSLPGSESFRKNILGEDGSWSLPLPPLTKDDLQPIFSYEGEEAARIEAAYKLSINHENIIKFACRGPGQVGRKQFSAPLADPYATPNLAYSDSVDVCLRLVCQALANGNYEILSIPLGIDSAIKEGVVSSLAYLRDRIGVPRDMSYPAARQLRAHLNWVIEKL